MVAQLMSPPIISSRNKSLVSLRESLQEGFLQHNVNNKSQATLLTVIDDNNMRKPACISPNTSEYNLRQQLAISLEEQKREQEEEQQQVIQTTQNISLDTRGPASIALANEEEERRKEEIALRKRKALAAKLRARGVSRKMVLKPSEFARSVFFRNRKGSKQNMENLVFPKPTEIDMEIHAKHSQTIYDFVRKGVDLEGFKKCVRELQRTYHGEEGQTQHFRCSNRFGESLMHLACRRGRTDMVRFLVEELPGSSPSQMLSIKDDCLKTPLHDACWTPSPNFELVEFILQHAPEQVVMQDIRGNTPFDYVRKEDYHVWLRFLWERRSLLGPARRGASSSTGALPTN